MGWEPVPQGRGHGTAAVCVSLAPFRPNGGSLLHVTLPSELVRKLGWAAKEPLTLLVGTEEHRGQVRVARAADGQGAALRRLPHGTRLMVSLRPGSELVGVRAASAPAAYVIESSGLTITLPWEGLEDAIAAAARAAEGADDA